MMSSAMALGNRITDDCVDEVMEPARKAYNAYWRANDQWNDCIVDFWNCDVDDDILADLRAKWRSAGRFLSKMERGLRSQRVAPPGDEPTPPD